jgi:release factor glutamine methyltransferase
MTIKETLDKSKKELKAARVAEPESSAEFLLRSVLGYSRADLYANLSKKIPLVKQQKFKVFIKKRKKHEPVWQITGSVDFFGRTFKVNKNVLVPRPETEFLVADVLQAVAGRKSLRILDVGTGAGPVIITLAAELKGVNFRFFSSDISPKALAVAKKNARENGVEKKIMFKKSDLLRGWKGERFDIITANLPYIPHEDLPGLALDIHHYEPRLALDGGPGGLVIYEEFFRQLPEHVAKKAVVFCEIGKGQGQAFKKIAKKALPKAKVTIIKDLARIDRFGIIEF